MVCMMNPSTATQSQDDPTIRRVIGFAERMNATGVIVTNLYAARATDPDRLLGFDDPVGPHNDVAISSAAAFADVIVAAWGSLVTRLGVVERADQVLETLRRFGTVWRLGAATKCGQPRHPLYLPRDPGLHVHREESAVRHGHHLSPLGYPTTCRCGGELRRLTKHGLGPDPMPLVTVLGEPLSACGRCGAECWGWTQA